MKRSNKIIRDSLHGYISLPVIIFSEIIDTQIFQRLKRIEQTSMRPLYPSAHHDRFIHSLGVYYLGEKALDGLLRNIESTPYYTENENTWKEYGLFFKIACLLHDCGHAPFSHSFEYAYIGKKGSKKWIRIKESLKNSLKDLHDPNFENLTEKEQSDYDKSVDKLFDQGASPHEVFSAIVISKHFRNGIKAVSEILLDEFNLTISHIEFIQRAILGMKYDIEQIEETEQDKYNVLNCLIQLLNSKSFDVDKLDYIMRDSAASGVENLSVDIERILNALTIIETHKYSKPITIDSDINNSVILQDIEADINENCFKKCELNLTLHNIRIAGIITGHINMKEGSIRYKEANERTVKFCPYICCDTNPVIISRN